MGQALRKGMWVMYQGTRIGILHQFLDSVTSELHLIDAATGETTTIIQATNTDLAQATFMDIPEARRPDLETARSLGY